MLLKSNGHYKYFYESKALHYVVVIEKWLHYPLHPIAFKNVLIATHYHYTLPLPQVGFRLTIF